MLIALASLLITATQPSAPEGLTLDTSDCDGARWQRRACRIAEWSDRPGLEGSSPRLRETLEARAGRDAQCRAIVDLAIGGASGNHSYGGICVSDDTETLICFDLMVGHAHRDRLADYAAQNSPELTETGLVASFVYDHCYGG